MAFNEFRPNLKDQTTMFADLKAKLNEIGPNFGAYLQNGNLVIPVSDLQSARVSVTLAAGSGKKVVGINLTF